MTVTERQKHEIDFYAQYAQHQRVESVSFEPVLGIQSRPWNPYWYIYEFARNWFTDPTQRLLDFGCGIGIAAVRLAYVGYQVDGFDISQANIDLADELAAHHHLSNRCRFATMAAERLEYANNTFDIIVGIDILHHVDVSQAIAEAYRLLKPGGVAVFKEHVEVPVVDAIRKTRLMQIIAPVGRSLEHHITEDERKLDSENLRVIQDQFDQVHIQRFTVLSRLDRIIPHCSDKTRGRLQRLDYRMLKLCPPLAHFGGTGIFICRKRSEPAQAPPARLAA